MTMRTSLAAALCVCATAAAAQVATEPVQELREQRPSPRHEIRMQVNFSIPVDAMGADRDKLAAAQSKARRGAYETALRECAAIIDTIADECRLDGLSVNTPANFNPMMMLGQVTANATYRIVLKP